MPYQVRINRSAEKELDALQSNLRDRIINRLLQLEENPRPYGVKKLQGQEAYRLRVGNYRILYTVNDAEQLLIIYAIGHRREVYR
jgi:mRNA interferase RelE/StbE